jgi:hypothetical protein
MRRGVNVVQDCRGWRTPDKSWLDVEVMEDEEMYFFNMVTWGGRQGQARGEHPRAQGGIRGLEGQAGSCKEEYIL